ncbi:MAG: TIGR03032 family protein [Planctomycetaceae bacterium]|nr:TIGR03032 family protein [Planctomycetaceae bacterium]
MNQPKYQIFSSPGFASWLRRSPISLAFSTYQIGKLFFVGTKSEDRLSVFERTFNRVMGLWSDTQTFWLASAFQLWRLDNVLDEGATTEDGYDRLFVPSLASTTGDIDAHDVAVNHEQQLIFVNTLFSCLSSSSDSRSFAPFWQPAFITKLAAEDRCHLNGLACDAGVARFVTACADTDHRQGWRDHRTDGGLVIDVASQETVVRGLSMPHSPRVRNGELWLLDSGHGYLGRVDVQRGKFERVAFCPGYARGLTFHDRYAIIGVSRPRENTFSGLPLDAELAKHQAKPICGLQVVDLESGQTVEWLQIQGLVEELYDVVVLPGVSRPKALGLQTDEIRHNVWFREGEKTVRWTAGDPPPRS